ncbi:unnamed protein product [Urochloa decumbens]|uniref:Factor of DNA methylation 1-5/IDN2 domain-containing protein n=1 Tax=Urochloa decumbens TaxID=240449 RepID=A0ABC9AFJ5_9POAL
MAPAGGGDETGESARPPTRRVVDRSAAAGVAAGQNIREESGSRKRKVAVVSKDFIGLAGNGENSKVACEDSNRILKEIEDLRAQLDEDVKELGYCEANQKLRVELALKANEMQCLRKQNEEMQVKNDGMRKQNEEMQVKNDGMRKQNEELQTKNDGLAKQNKELQAKNDGLVKENVELRTNIENICKRNVELQAKNGGLTKWNAVLQAKNGGLTKQNEELQAKSVSLAKQNEELQAKSVSLVKQNEEVQANNDSIKKLCGELQAKNDGLTMSKEKLQAKNDRLTEWIGELEDKNEDLEDLNGSLVRKERNNELLQARKELTMGLEDKLNWRPAIRIKRMGELEEKPFQDACKRKFGNVDYQTKAAKLVESWQDELKKPSWHPFVVVQVNGEHKEVLDDDDAKLKLLRFEYGDDVCNAVKTALMEINEYSPSERCVVPVFWNFRKGRKATMKEILYLFGQMETTTKRGRG